MICIKKIEPILVSCNYGDGKVLGQPLGVKTIGLVQVSLSNGTVGFGEAYVGIYVPDLFRELVNFFSKILINTKFELPNKIYKRLYIPFCSRNGLMASAYSAIDTALWDAYCKSNKISFAEANNLVIESNKKIYWSGGSAAFSTLEIVEELKELNYDIFSGYKLRIGRQNWDLDRNRIEVAKAKFLTDYLMIDAIMGTIRPAWNLKEWIEKKDFINLVNPYWIEEPLNPENINEIIDLKKLLKSKIAFGEALTGILELNAYINCPGIDVLQLDFTHLGGPSTFLEIKNIIEKSKKRVAMHIWGSPIAFNVNAYLGMCLKNCDWIEYPSVNLEISKYIDENYYNRMPSLMQVSNLIGFTNSYVNNINFRDFKYIPNSGFRL